MAAGCSKSIDGANSGSPRSELEISRGGKELLALKVQLALTPADQSKGLMGVKSLPDDSGMAFLFAAPVQYGFFMKDTLIPLDIAFWDEQGKIVDILQMEPCRSDPCPSFIPDSPYVGALEVNKGLLASEGIKPGDKVELKRSL